MRVAIVLPRNMHFGPDRATSIDLCAHDLALHSRFRATTKVFGAPVERAFEDVGFEAVAAADHPAGPRDWTAAIARFGADVVLVHQHAPTATRIARRLAPTPVLLYRHRVPMRRRWLGRQRDRLAYRRFARIVWVSATARDGFLAEFPELSARCAVAPNGLDTTDWAPGDKRCEMIFVGRARVEKGALAALRAFELWNDPSWRLRLVLAVTNPDEERIAGEARRRAARLGERVVIERNLAATEVRDRMAAARICVMPSLAAEGFGRVAIEALSCGARLIATRAGGLVEAAGDHACYLGDAEPESIAAAMARLAREDDPDAIARARVFVAATYDIRAVAGRMDDLLIGCVSRSGGSRRG